MRESRLQAPSCCRGEFTQPSLRLFLHVCIPHKFQQKMCTNRYKVQSEHVLSYVKCYSVSCSHLNIKCHIASCSYVVRSSPNYYINIELMPIQGQCYCSSLNSHCMLGSIRVQNCRCRHHPVSYSSTHGALFVIRGLSDAFNRSLHQNGPPPLMKSHTHTEAKIPIISVPNHFWYF